MFGQLHDPETRYGRIINIASISSFVALYEVACHMPASGSGIADEISRYRMGQVRSLRECNCIPVSSEYADLNAAPPPTAPSVAANFYCEHR